MNTQNSHRSHKSLWSLLSLLSLLWIGADPARAFTAAVNFDLSSWGVIQPTNRSVLLTPLSLVTSANQVPVYDKAMVNSRSGSFWISNMIPGTYSGVIQGPPSATYFSFYVDSSNAVQYAGAQTLADENSTWPPDSRAWSAAAADQRYSRRGELPGYYSGEFNGLLTTSNHLALRQTDDGAGFQFGDGESVRLTFDTNGVALGKPWDTNSTTPNVLLATDGAGRFRHTRIGIDDDGHFSADGSGLTNLPGEHVSGAVPLAIAVPYTGMLGMLRVVETEDGSGTTLAGNSAALRFDDNAEEIYSPVPIRALGFEGDGSGLTDLLGSAVAGAVAEATHAVFASNDSSGNDIARTYQTADQVATIARLQMSSGTNNLAGTFTPFDAQKTFLVFLGDSITAWAGGNPSYTTHITNFPAWSGLHWVTNVAVGGQHFSEQTNLFFTSVVPSLPESCSNGTNVIVSFAIGGNDWTAGTNVYFFINEISNFATWCGGRGYTFVCPTVLQRDYDLVNGPAVFKHWLAQATNLVYAVPDFYDLAPDPKDPVLFADGTHPTPLLYFLMAEEWDRSVRFPSQLKPERRVLDPISQTNVVLTVRGMAGGQTAHLQDWVIPGSPIATYVSGQGIIYAPSFVSANGIYWSGGGMIGPLARIGDAGTGVFFDTASSYIALKTSSALRWKILNTGDLESQLGSMRVRVNELQAMQTPYAYDQTGSNVVISAGIGRGSAAGGDIVFKSSAPGSSSTSENAQVEIARLKYNGALSISHNLIMKCPNGGSFILTVTDTGTLNIVTNSAGL